MAAHLYLSGQSGAKSAYTKPVASGLVMDYGTDGQPIGLGMTARWFPGKEWTRSTLKEQGDLQVRTLAANRVRV